MPSNFPTSNDSFAEPSSPSNTPLSSAGDGDYNHWEHHRQLGDAVEAIEANVPILTHNHSGTGPRATPKLDQANTHQNVDTDVSDNSIHHTLGQGTYQALSLAIARTALDPRYMRKDGNVNEVITGIKTLDRPTVSNLTNMQHNHSDATQGGLVAVAGRENDTGQINVVMGANTTRLISVEEPFSIPANVGINGIMVADISFPSNQRQGAYLYAYLAPAGKTAVDSTFITNNIGTARVIWPQGSSTIPGDEATLPLTHLLSFSAISTPRTNMRLYAAFTNSTGGSQITVIQIRALFYQKVEMP